MDDSLAVAAVNDAISVLMAGDPTATLPDALTRIIAQAASDLEGIADDLEHWSR